MKKYLALLIFLLAITVPATAQLGYDPPPDAAYCLYNNSWIPMSQIGGTALSYTPPPIGLYGVSGTQWYPLACDASGNIQTSMGNYATAPLTCSTGQTYFNTANSTPYYCSALNTWTAFGGGGGSGTVGSGTTGQAAVYTGNGTTVAGGTLGVVGGGTGVTATTATTEYYVDGNRVDSYTPDGSNSRPFLTMDAALAQINSQAASCTSGALCTYSIHMAPALYTSTAAVSTNNYQSIVLTCNGSTWVDAAGMTFNSPMGIDHCNIGTVTTPTDISFEHNYTTQRSKWSHGSNYGSINVGSVSNTAVIMDMDGVTVGGLTGGAGYSHLNVWGITYGVKVVGSINVLTKNATSIFSCDTCRFVGTAATANVDTTAGGQAIIIGGDYGTASYIPNFTLTNANSAATAHSIQGTVIVSGQGLSVGASTYWCGNLSGGLAGTGITTSCSGSPATTTNALTAAATGGAAPGSTFNGSAAVTFDYHSFGAASPQQVQQQTFSYAADTGSANAYAVTLSPVPSLVAGEPVVFLAAHTNTGASTLAVNGGSPIAIYKQGGMIALAAGDIVSGQMALLGYDGTHFQMQSQSGIAPATLGANTFTGNQTAPGLTLSTVANVAAPTGVATTVGGQSVPASATNEAAITCIDSSGLNTTIGTASGNVTTTGAASYIVWSYTLPSGCTTGYIWLKNTGSFAYYSVATGSSFQQNAAYTTYTAATSYPAGAAYPTANTTGLIDGVIVSGFGAGNVNVGGGLSLTSTGSYNTAQGYQALYSNTTGSYNTAQGYYALYSNTTGNRNSAQGYYALYSNTTGGYNSAQGYQALYSNTTGSYNTAQGYEAGRYISDGSTANATSSNSVYFGVNTEAGASGDTNENVIGNAAVGNGSNTTTLGNSSTIGTWKFGTQHVIATAPTASAGSVSVYSTNAGGEITGLSAATSVTITFANSGWTNAAFCTATPSTTLATVVYNSAQSNTAVTFTFPALTGKLFYHCDGN